jgi:hypothetical protein
VYSKASIAVSETPLEFSHLVCELGEHLTLSVIRFPTSCPIALMVLTKKILIKVILRVMHC